MLTADAVVDNYWMRFTGLMDCDERFTKSHQVSVLHYEGASEEEPRSHVGYNVHKKRDLVRHLLYTQYKDKSPNFDKYYSMIEVY